MEAKSNSPPAVSSWQFAAPSLQSIHVAFRPLDPPTVEMIELRSALPAALLPCSPAPLLPPPPRVLSFPIRPAAVKVQTYHFRTPIEPPQEDSTGYKTAANASGEGRRAACPTEANVGSVTSTRLKPSDDIVKLEDRLWYVLQPSLETLMARGSLEFPHQPFPYQLQGVAFLYPRVSAVLADEMGLGKTMQAITAVRMLLHSGEIRSVLLVCPKPLVTNWQREFQQWAPEIPVMAVEGDPDRRAWQWRLEDAPVKIANYEALCRDAPLVLDEQLKFDLVLLDESQRIKNRGSTTNQVVCSLSRRRSWALTGTPVENSPEDLLGIFDFVSPGHLNEHMKPRAMGRAAADYVLRRTKDNVLTDLPPKLFRDAELELTREQRQSYTMAEDDGVLRLTEMGDKATIQHVFELVLRLKQICNFDPATGCSAKLERLAADLDEVAASGQKAIVFSQWVSTLTRLRGELQPFHPLEYHGQIPSSRRDAVIEQFRNNRKHHVMLMSYGAGGVGLNLQFCNYVFLFDRWWNPAVEDQAINRAHRIGVAGPVTVTRFLTLSSIEERINQVLEEKRKLFDMVFSDTAAPRALGLTQQEIFGLFKLRCPHGKIEIDHPAKGEFIQSRPAA